MPGGAAGEVDQETAEGGVVNSVTRPDGTAAEVQLHCHVLDTRPVGHYHDNDSDDD